METWSNYNTWNESLSGSGSVGRDARDAQVPSLTSCSRSALHLTRIPPLKKWILPGLAFPLLILAGRLSSSFLCEEHPVFVSARQDIGWSPFYLLFLLSCLRVCDELVTGLLFYPPKYLLDRAALTK